MAFIMQQQGWKTIKAEGLETALKIWKDQKPDAVLTDYNMETAANPARNGIDDLITPNRPLFERIKSYLMPQHNKIEEVQPPKNAELEVNVPAFVKRENEILKSLNILRESGTQMDTSLYVSGMSTAQMEHFERLLTANNFTFQMVEHEGKDYVLKINARLPV